MQDGALTMRDWFAGQAVSGLCSNTKWMENAPRGTGDCACAIARAAYEVAEALLKARD